MSHDTVGNNHFHRSCPACENESTELNLISSKIKAECLRFDELIPYWNGFFKENIYFSYARCTECGLLYAPIYFNDSEIERLYSQMPANMAEVPISALRSTQRGYFDSLKNYSKLTGPYIEVGPDTGLFTEYCVSSGKFDEYWLFEPNLSSLPELEKVLIGQHYKIINDMLGFHHIPDHAGSVAVIIHVLDHLLDPVAVLRQLKKKLQPDAKLLLVTHDESSLLRHLVGNRWPAFCLQHPQIYNSKSIRLILDRAGFDVIKTNKTINYFQIGFLLKHLFWAFGLKIQNIPLFGQITIGLPLGNILTLATPKANKFDDKA